MTPRQSSLLALLFIPMPPDNPLAQDRSSGTFTSLMQSGQQVPESSGATNLKGGLHSTAAQLMPVHVSAAPLPGEKTGYLRAEAITRQAAQMTGFIIVSCGSRAI